MTTPTVVDPPSGGKDKPALEYTPRFGAGGAVTVRGIRLLVVFTLINTTLLGMSVLGPQLFPFLSQQWQQWKESRAKAKAKQVALALQQQCLDHAAPPGKVAYEEDPVEAARLRADGASGYGRRWGAVWKSAPPGWVPPAAAPVPSYLPLYADAIYGARISGINDPVLFLHGRTTRGGARYVVCVQLAVSLDFDWKQEGTSGDVAFRQMKQRILVAHAWPAGAEGPSGARGTGLQRSVDLVLPDRQLRVVARMGEESPVDSVADIDYGNVLRIHEGQPDPNDASHFTIPYRLDGRDGLIDGWIKDDVLELRPREGKRSFEGSIDAWILPSGPATRPLPPAGNSGQPQFPP